MKLNNTLSGVIAAAALAAVSSTAAIAGPSTVLASSTGSTSPNVTYTSGSSFTGTDPATVYIDRTTNSVLVPTPFTLNAGTAGSFVTASTGDTQNFISGGSFSYGTAGSVLAGTFATSTLTQTGVNTFAFVANDVVFTGGSHLDGFSTGSLQLEAIDAAPISGTSFVNAGGTGFNSFTATDGVTIDGVKATTVPEPASVVPFLLGGLGLMALIVRKNRKASGVTA